MIPDNLLQSQKKFQFGVLAILALMAIAFIVFQLWTSFQRDRLRRDELATQRQQSAQLVQQMVSSEELLLELTPRLRTLSNDVLNLQLPTTSVKELFADQVKISGAIVLKEQPRTTASSDNSERWSISSHEATVPSEQLRLWTELIAETAYFENTSFYFIRGSFDSENFNRFTSLIGFDGLAIHADQSQTGFHIEMEVDWTRKTDTNSKTPWQISSWKHNSIKTLESSLPIFQDVLPQLITDPVMLKRATVSQHDQITADVLAGKDYFLPEGETYPFFFPDVTLEHPGIAVVDIDRDGFDDLYVAMQHGSNLLFRNRGDGTFEEVAAKYGLDLVEDSTSAIFADFDNDGDADLFLGRARHRSMYLSNDNGRFTDRSAEKITCPLPALVSSISTTDFNRDGLLDVYLSTYSPIEEANRFAEKSTPLWLKHFLTPEQALEFEERNRGVHRFTNRSGPPNLLLQNVGDGRFKVADANEQLELWRMTFQASWSDFDSDGDPDIYVANDYAPDNLFRNDGPLGFTDITRDVGLTGLGFGMGVAWDDYDNDGQMDIYVSNMFSKAGQRITSQFSELDPRIREMAAGNFLYRGNQNEFKLVSGLGETDLKVAKAGWSWGGQFFDFDNDGYRDIYALSGYYTAPTNVAIDIDL